MVTRPLTGVRVLDLTRFVAGSYATLVLSALGAEVLKLEMPPEGDPYRNQGTIRLGDQSVLFMSLNSGKKSVALDFRSTEARTAMDALIDSVDVVLENSRPGSLGRYGLDYEAVRARNPRVVYGSISGFGDVGPQASAGGFDLILQAVGGLMSVTGHPETGPAKVGAPVTDVGAGMACAAGVLGGLVHRAATGNGCHIATSLLEFTLASLTTLATAYLAGGDVPGLLGSHSPTFAPYGAFRARDGWMVLAGAGSEDLWKRCCHAIGAVALVDDPRFSTNAARVENRDTLTREIEAILAKDDVDAWIERLSAAGVPAGRINDLSRAFTGAQVQALGILRELKHETAGRYPVIGVPIRADGQPLPSSDPAPRLGEHTRQVLLEVGLTESYIDSLVATGHAMELA